MSPSDGGYIVLSVEPKWGIIFQPWQDEPTYHRLDPTRSPRPWASKTLCGRKVGDLTPMLPFKHVKKFGRPCKGCFDA